MDVLIRHAIVRAAVGIAKSRRSTPSAKRQTSSRSLTSASRSRMRIRKITPVENGLFEAKLVISANHEGFDDEIDAPRRHGLLVIAIQNKSPGSDKEANWLPAPKGKFKLMLRLYWPDENEPSILDGSWIVPAVKRA